VANYLNQGQEKDIFDHVGNFFGSPGNANACLYPSGKRGIY